MWKKRLRVLIAGALVLTGCWGTAPTPILSYQPGDEKRSCTSLKAEIASNEVEMIRLASEKDSTTGKNVALGVTGALLIVPLFFMDFKGKEAREIAALRHRNRNLRQFAVDKKDCTVPESKVKFEDKEETTKKSEDEK
jgi:hypothetical protein